MVALDLWSSTRPSTTSHLIKLPMLPDPCRKIASIFLHMFTRTPALQPAPAVTCLKPSVGHQESIITHCALWTDHVANQVVKDSGLRDKLGHGLGAHCVEMEAAGVVDNLPCLVIRSICDYADSHKMAIGRDTPLGGSSIREITC
ncbi:hypothetical protein BDV06DRAFT_129258 [Aspergillus oleicola]